MGDRFGLLTFFGALTYSQDMLFTFGCGGLILVLCFLLRKFQKLFVGSFVTLGLSMIGFGIILTLEKQRIVERGGWLLMLPSLGLFIFIIMVSLSGYRMANGNAELERMMKLGIYLVFVFAIPFFLIVFYALLFK
ncbi:hypothetical protein ACFFSY_09410 [Paenibacillus aurantiacus]|uniref:Uncharacterized protein n=1 Tax=Paenibacillus aurantiacus TaxID=1936118 RepID=A0ABV5KLL9_9BACL